MVKYLVGLCSDLKPPEQDKGDVYSDSSGETEDGRSVTRDEALKFAREQGLSHYMETSSVSGENVELLFTTLAKHLFISKASCQEQISTSRLDTSITGADRLQKSFRLSALSHGDGYSPVSVILDSHKGSEISERKSTMKPKRKRCCYKS